jgi:Fe2+ transport system protein FeoA
MVYEVIDIPQSDNCENCVYCMRVKLMEIGFITGQDVEIQKKQWGLYVVNLLSKSGHVEQTIALREEEFSRICLKEKL